MSLVILMSFLYCGMLSNHPKFVLAEEVSDKIYGEDIYHNGPYTFVACKSWQGKHLETLFRIIGSVITDKIIPHLTSSTPPDPKEDPAAVFFSYNDRNDIARVFQHIVDAPSPRPPIVCLNEDSDPFLAEELAYCNDPARQTQAFVDWLNDGSKIILLCPNFFERNLPYPYMAPDVNARDRRFWSTNSPRILSQFSIIIHELAHTYMRDPLPDYYRESYDLNTLTYLSAPFQLRNAENYAALATCKLPVGSIGGWGCV